MKPKRCLIIGATSDIAKELIYLFAKDGYSLDLVARRMDELERIKKDLNNRFNIEVNNYFMDIENLKLIDSFIQTYPYTPDITVFAIGYLGNQKLAEINIEEAIKITNINYTNQIPLLNHFANIMEQNQKGTIIGISSIAGERGRKTNYYYGAAKAALTQHLSGLRQRLHKSNVRVITIKPGFIKTKMTSHLSVPSIFEGSPKKVAQGIYTCYKSNKSILITPPIYYFLNVFIKLLPEKLFKQINL